MIDVLAGLVFGPGPMVVALVVAAIFYVSVKEPAMEYEETQQ